VYVNSAQGSRVRVKKGSSWTNVVAWDGLHEKGTAKQGTIALNAGYYKVRVDFFNKDSENPYLDLQMSGPGLAKGPMKFYRKLNGDNRIHGGLFKSMVVHGSYRLHLDPGNYVLIGHRGGYTSFREGVEIEPMTAQEQPLELLSNDKKGQLTAVLTWGSRPSDLDAYMVMDQPSCTVNWEKRTCPGVALSVDAIDSHGPETITISSVKHTGYTFKVVQHSNDGTLLDSNAIVRVRSDYGEFVFKVGRDGHISSNGKTWTVFSLDGSSGEMTASRSG